MISNTKAWALYAITAIIFASMTPVRWWLEAQVGSEFSYPDLEVGMTLEGLWQFKLALMTPVAGGTGTDLFLTLHTYSLDLALPALTGLCIGVFLWRAGAKVPRFSEMETRAKLLACLIVALPCVMTDYLENYKVASILAEPLMPVAKTAATIAVLTTLKGACLVFAAAVCLTFQLATLKKGKTT